MNKYNKWQQPEQKPKQSSTNFPNSSKILKEVKLLLEVSYAGQDGATLRHCIAQFRGFAFVLNQPPTLVQDLSRALTTQLESTVDDGRKNGASLEPPISWARVLCLQLKHPERNSESMLQGQVVLDQVIPVVLSCFLHLVSAKMDLQCPCLVLQLSSHYRLSKYFLPLWAQLPIPPYRPKAFSTSPKEGTSQLGSLPANPAQCQVIATMSPHCRDISTSPVGAFVTPLPSYIPCSLHHTQPPPSGFSKSKSQIKRMNIPHARLTQQRTLHRDYRLPMDCPPAHEDEFRAVFWKNRDR